VDYLILILCTNLVGSNDLYRKAGDLVPSILLSISFCDVWALSPQIEEHFGGLLGKKLALRHRFFLPSLGYAIKSFENAAEVEILMVMSSQHCSSQPGLVWCCHLHKVLLQTPSG